MSNYDTYREEDLKKRNKATDEQLAKRKEDDAALKEQLNVTYDASADAAANPYRQEIDQAPLDSRALYDQNAMAEAVNRKKITETLANMGMTDSGLSSSMQTALTVQKSNADNKVRATEQQRIRAAESEIDRIFANNEIQKSQKAIEIDQTTAEWDRTQRANNEALAAQTATSMVNAETEAQANQQKMALDIHNKRVSVAQDLIKKGVNNNEAWAQAYAAYPDTSTKEGVQYAQYKQLRESGYGGAYATAMSKAYADAWDKKATESEVNNAMMAAMLSTAEEEIHTAGVDLQGGVVFGGGSKERINPSAEYAARIANANLAKLADVNMSDTAKMYATACMTGNAYAAILNDGNAQKIGEALAQNFGGIYLEVALSYAGLE